MPGREYIMALHSRNIDLSTEVYRGHEFLYAMDRLERCMGALAREDAVPAAVHDARAALLVTLPRLRGIQDSVSHHGERIRGMEWGRTRIGSGCDRYAAFESRARGRDASSGSGRRRPAVAGGADQRRQWQNVAHALKTAW